MARGVSESIFVLLYFCVALKMVGTWAHLHYREEEGKVQKGVDTTDTQDWPCPHSSDPPHGRPWTTSHPPPTSWAAAVSVTYLVLLVITPAFPVTTARLTLWAGKDYGVLSPALALPGTQEMLRYLLSHDPIPGEYQFHVLKNTQVTYHILLIVTSQWLSTPSIGTRVGLVFIFHNGDMEQATPVKAIRRISLGEQTLPFLPHLTSLPMANPGQRLQLPESICLMLRP